MPASGFKVIVAGGGPVGLTAAHALEKAGIDFVLLEQRPHVVIDAGSNLVLNPTGIRVLSKLGLQDAIEAVSSPLGRIDRLDHQGRDIGDLRLFEQMKETAGVAPRVLSRHDLTKVLYENLRHSQDKILPNKKIQDITYHSDGVRVDCADGTSYSGSIVIGADGAHSRVRSLMRSLALKSGSADINPEDPFLTTYRALWIRIPMDGRLNPGMTCETHGYKLASQLFTGPESAVMGVYERLEEPTRERQRYTIADQEALVKRWDSLPLVPDGSLTLGEAYRSKVEAGLVSLEEGVLDHWSWAGRIVLTGDAAHKFTPSTGAGCNNGMIDIVALVSELDLALQKVRDESGNLRAIPSQEDLVQVCQQYQEQRIKTVQTACDTASRATASATWASGIHKFLDQHILSKPIVTKLLISGIRRELLPEPMFQFIKQRDAVAAF